MKIYVVKLRFKRVAPAVRCIPNPAMEPGNFPAKKGLIFLVKPAEDSSEISTHIFFENKTKVL